MVRPPSLRLMIWLLLIAGGAKAVAALTDGAARAAGAAPPAVTAPAPAAAATASAVPAPGSAAAGSASAAVPAAEPAAVACKTPEELLQSVQQERALIDSQKADLAGRAAQLDLARQDLATQTAQLTALKDEVQGLLNKAQAAHNDDLGRLVNLYGSMKPADAASLLDGTDLEVSVMVLSTMNERQAGQIMAKMQPDRVQAVSKIILDRSKLPGDQNQVLVNLN